MVIGMIFVVYCSVIVVKSKCRVMQKFFQYTKMTGNKNKSLLNGVNCADVYRNIQRFLTLSLSCNEVKSQTQLRMMFALHYTVGSQRQQRKNKPR